MSDLLTANQTITFAKTVDSGGFQIVLDSTLNGGKTSFAPGDVAYLKVYPGGYSPSRYSTLGNITVLSTNLEEIVPADNTFEYVVFSRDDSSNFNFKNLGVISWSWCGRQADVQPSFKTHEISFSKQVSCVLKVKYKTCYDSWKLSNVNIDSKVLVEAIKKPNYTNIFEEMYGSTTVDFSIAEGGGEEDQISRVYLTIRDACTQQIIPGATLELLDKTYVADANGRVDLGYLPPGTYDIRITAVGYQNSDEDRIGNDTLVIN